jgi:hypothetical protein
MASIFRSCIWGRQSPLVQLIQHVVPTGLLDCKRNSLGKKPHEPFAPEEARRIARKLEWHYTPEHGSWLNIAECELSVLARQCLARRLADVETLQREVAAWEHRRTQAHVTIDWRFTTADARIKLKRLYPVLKEQKAA